MKITPSDESGLFAIEPYLEESTINRKSSFDEARGRQ